MGARMLRHVAGIASCRIADLQSAQCSIQETRIGISTPSRMPCGDTAQRGKAATKSLDCAGRAKRRRRFRTWPCASYGRARRARTKAVSESGTTFLTVRSANSRTCRLEQQWWTARFASNRSPKDLRGLRRFLAILIDFPSAPPAEERGNRETFSMTAIAPDMR